MWLLNSVDERTLDTEYNRLKKKYQELSSNIKSLKRHRQDKTCVSQLRECQINAKQLSDAIRDLKQEHGKTEDRYYTPKYSF